MPPDILNRKGPVWAEVKVQIETELNDYLPQRSKLEQFRQQDWWFTYKQYENHDAPHEDRVLVLINLGLAVLKKRGVDFPQSIKEALSWTAVTHDTQVTGKNYIAHGRDAAEWVGKNLKGAMDRETRFLTQYYCMNHGLLDKYLIGQNYVYDQDLTMVDVGLKLFRDADAVDRVRFPKHSPDNLDENFLRLPVTKEILLPVAQELFARTNKKQMSCDEGFGLVMAAAVDMGIIR